MFSGRSEQKILAWRDFRSELITWPDDIERVASTWAKAPLSGNYLIYDDPKKWPDAWTLMGDGVFCNISIALGMFYTLYYSSYDKKDTMKLEHYHLPDQHQTLNLVSLEDGKYMLNYHLGRSVNITRTENLICPKYTLTAQDLPIKN